LAGIDKAFLEVTAVVSAYDGDDARHIHNLLQVARKILVTLSLGELFCNNVLSSVRQLLQELVSASQKFVPLKMN
jgi:hypothetical protein